jgi:hypothetical protein
MLVRFLSYLGKEGFGEQFYGEYELGGETRPCTIRWAAEPRGGLGKDNPLARVRDAGLLMQLYPDPLVPRVLAVTPCWNGLAVVSEAPEGLKLAELEQRPLPEPVILEVVRQVSGMLDRVYTRKDANTGEMLRTMHRAISTECIYVRADGTLRVTGFEKMSTVWSARAAETSALATHPGARLAPEQMAGEVFHATDVYLAGLVAVDLLVNPERASQAARMLAMCICDPEGFEEIREEILSDDKVEATTNLRGLLRSMLQEDPKSRPAASIIANMAGMVGASEAALREFALSLEMPPAPEGLFHQFVGRTLELPDPELRPFPKEQALGPAPTLDEPLLDRPPVARKAAPAEPDIAPAAEAPPPAEPEDIEEITDVGALQEPAPAPGSGPVAPPPPPGVASVTPASAPPRAEPKPPPAPVEEEPPPAPVEEEPAPTPVEEEPPPAPVQEEPPPAPVEEEPLPAPVEEEPPPPPVEEEPPPAPVEEEPPAPPPAPVEPEEDPELGAPMPLPIKPGKEPPPVDQPLAAKPPEGPIEEPAPFEPPAPVEDDELDAPKKKSKLPLILGVLALLFVLSIVCCGGAGVLWQFVL